MLQLTATLANSIQALTRSSVDVRVTAVVAANGAAVNATTLASFPSDKSSNAQLYVAALLGSGSSSIFTSTLGTVTVDPSSVQISLAVPQAGTCHASPCRVGQYLAMLPFVLKAKLHMYT